VTGLRLSSLLVSLLLWLSWSWFTNAIRITKDEWRTKNEWAQRSELLYDWRFTANEFLATSPLRPTTRIYIFRLNICGYSSYVTSLWREDGSVVYSCCWSSPAQSFSGLSLAGLMTAFYCLQIRDSPNLKGQVPVFISPRNRVARLYPQALGCLILSHECVLVCTAAFIV
jgi:hypothetical protein